MQPIDITLTRAFYLSFQTPFTSQYYVIFLLDPLSMPTVFINLILFLALYVLIAIHAMKLLNISFGTALGGTLCIKNISVFYDFLVL